jgi:hypothetical protein
MTHPVEAHRLDRGGPRDGNGVFDGETEVGVLPGLDGAPVGLADALDHNQCIVAHVLGGAWDDPQR